jgi:non-canonical (house-cleaning) NTP pyrophosphatase
MTDRKYQSHVIVGSTSRIKLEAVQEALEQCKTVLGHHGPFEVGGVSAPSKVSEQPVGHEETLRGAKWRAKGAQEKQPKADLWVGIENGLFWEEDLMGKVVWYDAAKIYIKAKTNSFIILISDKLYIPVWLMENVYGTEQLVALKHSGTDKNWAGTLKDPHSVYSAWKENGARVRSRKDYLRDTIVEAFQ